MNENFFILTQKFNAVKKKNLILEKLYNQSKQDNKDALSSINATICDMQEKLNFFKQKHFQLKQLNNTSNNTLKENINLCINNNINLLNGSLNYKQTNDINNLTQTNKKYKNKINDLQNNIHKITENINKIKTDISNTENDITSLVQKIADIKIFVSVNYDDNFIEQFFKICNK